MCSRTVLLLLSTTVLFGTPVSSRSFADFQILRHIRNPQQISSTNPKIESLHVRSHVRHRYATTHVVTSVRNFANTSDTAQFSVLLPENALITNFSLMVGEKSYKSFVKERQPGRQRLVDQSLAPGYLAVSARNSQHFYITVNLAAGEKVNFDLSYEQLLSRKLGHYSHVISLYPGQVVQDLNVTIDIVESQPLSHLSVLPLHVGGREPPDTPPDYLWEGVTVTRAGQRAEVVFAPSVELQQRLSLERGEGLAGQLVTRYDVHNSSPSGTLLVSEGYFAHWLAPASLAPLPKHVVFTLDVSGSMAGYKLQRLKEALVSILDDLQPQDHFNIIEFSYSVTVWDLDSLSDSAVIQPELQIAGPWWASKAELPPPLHTTPPTPTISVPPYPATPHYIERAKDVIHKMTAGGGTNIHGALKTAMLTVGASFANLTANKPEPIVIFLTDGDPTIGITDHENILGMVKELNVRQSAVFSLGFGSGADLPFLRRLSAANNGFARSIYEGEDTAVQLRDLYREVANPLLANLSFSYLPQQVVQSSLSRHHFHTVFQGSEAVVAGKLQPHTSGPITAKLAAITADGSVTYTTESARGEGVLERIWAFLSVSQSRETENKLVELALKYNFVTAATSLVVVKPDQAVEIDLFTLQPLSLQSRFQTANLLQPGTKRSQSDDLNEESTTSKIMSGEALSLADLQWPEGLVDTIAATVSLPLGVNGSFQQYRLGLHEGNQPLGECVSPHGEPAHCIHLPHCVLPDIVRSVSSYIRHYCFLPNGFAGICCPDTRHSSTTERTETTTGDTVATTTIDITTIQD